ncbi:MAG: 16S rRNA (adenine(1518)-N(6)/adenine(1519)-N(6))-dimethyltransferase RsmA [Bacteroidales bacterium]
MAGYVRPKKSLGQHFLTDTDIARRIAATVMEYKGLPVLEVGPGTGMLTQFLLNDGHDLKVVELDRESVGYLKKNYPQLNGRIIEGDFLEMNLSDIYNDKFCLIGNYPYNISSQIFFKVLDYKDHIPCCSGMIQKEVAERLAAGPGSKIYGILSILIQAWYDVEYLFTVSEDVFNPPPKVKSAVIRMTRNKVTILGCDEVLFKRIVKTAFNQRRKTMRNSLKGILIPGADILSDNIFNMRPEQISVAQFVKLTGDLEKYIVQ